MTSCSRLNLVRDEVSRLQGIGHPSSTHANTVANTNRTKLVSNNPGFRQGLLDLLTQTKKMAIASAQK